MAESQIELLNRREIEGAGRLAGYRNIWHALRLRHHVHVPRSLVARLIKKKSIQMACKTEATLVFSKNPLISFYPFIIRI